MRLLLDDGKGIRTLEQMSFMRAKQAAAVMDCIGRMIPQEGVDYDADIIFHETDSANVSVNITAHTDKGEWWKQYVTNMISKYPPTVEQPEMAIPNDNSEKEEEERERKEEKAQEEGKEIKDEEIVP